MLYIGVMSGTSLDGLDIALVELQAGNWTLRDAFCASLPGTLRQELLELCQPGHNELARVALAEQQWVHLAANAINQLLTDLHLDASDIRAIGSHGQTVRHEPGAGYTWQIGNPALLAELTGITVVSDFRRRDVAAGGQGAPLVPAFHELLFAHPEQSRALLNVGGFSNLSLLVPEQATRGFDCGPGNVLMDAWIQRHHQLPYDAQGAWAASGKVHQQLLQRMLAEPFFQQQGPKSTGRELFNLNWLDRLLSAFPEVSNTDVQATLLELTAQSCARALLDTLKDCQQLLLCGGGAHNHALHARLGELLPGIEVLSSSALGVDPDWMEAMAFAWLAHCCLQGIPANRPAVTGASGLRVLGAIYPA